jgi:hypothetical protein
VTLVAIALICGILFFGNKPASHGVPTNLGAARNNILLIWGSVFRVAKAKGINDSRELWKNIWNSDTADASLSGQTHSYVKAGH